MFCPQCKAEYRVGFVRCSDCDVELVEQLPADSPPVDLGRVPETDHPELVVLRTYPKVVDAQLAKTALDSVGIESMIRSDNEGGQSPGLSFARGVELLVRADDLDAAEDMLAVEGMEGGNPQ
jgi:hypothetical protein